MVSTEVAHNQVTDAGLNYVDLVGDNFGQPFQANREERKSFVSEEEEVSDFEYADETDFSYEEETEELCGLITEKQKVTLKKYLLKKEPWRELNGLGRRFDGGGKFVAAKPDGNCMFNAVSINNTASKDLPNGTDKYHDEIRQKCCDYIVKERKGKLAIIIAQRGLSTDEKFFMYVAKKRATTGEFFTWSDNITA